jgi:hypothetical protein
MKVVADCFASTHCRRKLLTCLTIPYVLVASHSKTDIINLNLFLNPITDFQFGINAAITRPENIEPRLNKGKDSP